MGPEAHDTKIQCGRCGATISANARYCPNCGASLGAADPMADPDRALLDDLRLSFSERYRVERSIGIAGSPTLVYRANDLARNCAIALKVLRPELTNTATAVRFMREIEITLGLHHPNVLRLYDSGRCPSRTVEGRQYVFLTTPLVEGETLDARLGRETELPVGDCVRIVGAVADALQYAHDSRVLHRDVKPANIWLSADGRVLLADFGIARAMGFEEAESRITQAGTIVGTPVYMSPEQLTNRANVDARADQYSLACVAYEMLVGKPPFPAGGVEGIWRQLQERPASIRKTRPTVPEHVETAILVALEKVPADRFATVAAFADAIRREKPGQRTPMWGALPGAVDEKSCFVITPFGDASNIQEVYRDVIIPTAEEVGLRVRRADDIFSHGEIIRDIWAAIGAARIIIADVTGRNANVFYELGMAHAIGKDVIMLAQDRADVPFDVTHLRYILYQYTPRGVKKLQQSLKGTLEAALRS